VWNLSYWSYAIRYIYQY